MPKLLVNIDVNDLAEAVAFYTAAFPLTPSRRFGQTAVELTGAEVPIYLLLKAPATPPFPEAATTRDYGRHWTPVHFDFVVEQLENAVERATGAGARTESAIERHPWGRMALMSDPFGHGFCLLELGPGGYDAIATPWGAP